MHIRQSAAQPHKDESWWKWAVWIEGHDVELESIEAVDWHLHSSFPDPIRRRTDRVDKFRMETSGWGEFRIRAVVVTRDGDVALEHQLRLFSTADEVDTADEARSIVIAGSPIDGDAIDKIAESVREKGYIVFREADLVGATESTAGLLSKADLVIEVVERGDSWQRQEVSAAELLGAKIMRSTVSDVLEGNLGSVLAEIDNYFA